MLDDFGAGYSSLGYVKKFPIGMLKIDRSLIADMKRDTHDTAIVEAALTMARGLGLRVVAEGVESNEHVSTLGALGCEFAQGYYYARPLPPEEMSGLLDDTLPRTPALALP